MSEVTAQQLIDRIKHQLGPSWSESRSDVIQAGSADTAITGITTSFTASIEVLRRSVVEGKNLIITQQPAFYQDSRSSQISSAGSGSVEDNFRNDPAYLYKKDFIEANQLVVWRLYDNWNARKLDGQLLGLTKALGWQAHHVHQAAMGNDSYVRSNHYYRFPEASLREKLEEMRRALEIQAFRVIGDPETKLRTASITNGMFKLSELQQILREPSVDLIVIAEAIEWESCEYFRDLLTWKGGEKAMILLGREVSEDPGYGEMASWLGTFLPEVPIKWIPADEPFWVP